MKDESNAPTHDPQSAIRNPQSAIPNLQSLITNYQLPIFLLAFVLRILPDARTIDDAYITFRYARNIVNGIGFVYNAGEYVLGTTTPLYTLLMAALSFILRSQNFPTIALWVNALADAITCVLLIALGETLSGQKRVGVAAALLYAVAPFSVTFAVGGMETSLFVLWIILISLLYLRRHPAYALCAALALLTRPDALIFILPLFAFQFLESIWRAFKENREGAKNAKNYQLLITNPQSLSRLTLHASLFLLPIITWALFAAYYFGSPLPHTITAKGFAYQLNPQEGFVRLWQHYANPFMEFVTFEKIPYGNFWVLPGIIIYFSLSLIAILKFFRRDARSLPITLYPFLYFITFAIANPLIFRWYLTPPLPIYFILIMGGLQQLQTSNFKLPTSAPSVRSLIPNLQSLISILHSSLFITLIFLSLRAWTLSPDHGPARPAPDMAWFKLEEIYTQIGKELAPQIDSKTVIAAGDIGALGYFSNARILDTVGLISAQTPPYYPLPREQLVINYAMSAQLINDYQPDYVVFLGLLLRQKNSNGYLWERGDVDLQKSNW
ncbi:MAG: hypothetical protein HZB52_04385 [Chloroflexi bacterium]|nr:hypothetical protein [Chloroflexota bacterium]